MFNTSAQHRARRFSSSCCYIPGHIESASGEGMVYQPLLQSGQISGRFPYFQMVQRNFLGAAIKPEPCRTIRIRWRTRWLRRFAARSAAEAAEGEESASPPPLHVITITDLDFISEQFFDIRRIGPENLNFDNVTFFLNAMDSLVGDESFVALRNRRVRHRTLARVENQTQSFIEQRSVEEAEAEADANEALAAAQRNLDERVAEVRSRDDLDAQTKQIMARNLEEVENRKLDVVKTNIDANKELAVRASEERMESQIRRIQSGIRTFAVLLPPIPVFALGVYIFFRRRQREREGAVAAHRLREGA